jgi:hypothetical protein
MITSYLEISKKIKHHLRPNHANSLFINGAPASGKSYLLTKIKECLPGDISGSKVFGPYKIKALCEFQPLFVEDLQNKFIIEDTEPLRNLVDFFSLWEWIMNNVKFPSFTKLIVLLDINYSDLKSIDYWRPILSGARAIEHTWIDDVAPLLIIISGYWDHQALRDFYKKIDLSDPYTFNENYEVLEGISEEELGGLLLQHDISTTISSKDFGLIFEFTGGHPGILIDVLGFMDDKELNMKSLMFATQKAVKNGKMAKKFINIWCRLSKSCKLILRELLFFGRYPYDLLTMNQLVVSGIGNVKEVYGEPFLFLKSYYVELLIRSNLSLLGLEEGSLTPENYLKNIVPNLYHFNILAYQMICDLENMCRNLFSNKLLSNNGDSDHILIGRGIKAESPKGEITDAYTRTLRWKDKSINSMDTPLITFLSTSDLGLLLAEVAYENGNDVWNTLSDYVYDLLDIRNSVMHSQMIGDEEIDRLIKIQKGVYSLISNWDDFVN